MKDATAGPTCGDGGQETVPPTREPEWREERGIDFSAYRMWHTGITNWVRAGVETLMVKHLAGHKSVVTTQRYVGELTREDLARIPSAFTRIY